MRYTGPPIRILSLLERELRDHFGLAPLFAAEEASRLEGSISRLIEDHIRDHYSNGTVASMAFCLASRRSIIGSCVVEPGDDEAKILRKQNWLQVGKINTKLKSLSFEEFELFGRRILDELGASVARVTPRVGDQGIDFYGVMDIGASSGIPFGLGELAGDLKLRFAGQAKHYPNSAVGPAVLRELIGSISLARYSVFTTDVEIFDDLGLLSFNPLVAMLFTTGTFTRGSQEIASKAGVIARSGIQLAAFLAERGIGIANDGRQYEFSDEIFDEWLHI